MRGTNRRRIPPEPLRQYKKHRAVQVVSKYPSLDNRVNRETTAGLTAVKRKRPDKILRVI